LLLGFIPVSVFSHLVVVVVGILAIAQGDGLCVLQGPNTFYEVSLLVAQLRKIKQLELATQLLAEVIRNHRVGLLAFSSQTRAYACLRAIEDGTCISST
jgi:hypothetical protein